MSMDSKPAFVGGISAARKAKNKAFSAFCLAAICIAIAILLYLLVSIVIDGAPRLSSQFLSSYPSRLPARAGIKAALFGTIWVVGLSALIAVPIGVAAAIYLEEMNQRKNKLTDFIQVNIANLAGVPSIVYGLLGLALFVRWLAFDRSILSGALTMALLILPMIILVSQEALKAVPQSYRDASLALGATRWQTIRRQVLPNAAPGIFTGIILAVSRAIGETAPLITIGAATAWFVPSKVSDSFTVLPIQIFDWSSRAQKGFHENAAAAILVLLIVLIALNSIAIFLRARAQKKAV
jgi:phosphate transport system permease protein